jgi:hypothetical protein
VLIINPFLIDVDTIGEKWLDIQTLNDTGFSLKKRYDCRIKMLKL